MASNLWKPLSVVFLIWAIGASVGLAYYYQTSQTQQTLLNNYASVIDYVAIKVNLGIDYGNETMVWNNNTYVPINAPLLNATMKLAQVNYTVTPYGIWVYGINGVFEDAGANKYWLYYVWSGTSWEMGAVGAGEYIPANGDSIKWVLTQF